MQEKFHAEDVLLEKNIMHVNLPFWFTLLLFLMLERMRDSSKQILLIFTPNLTLGVTNVCKVSNFCDDLKYFLGVYKGVKM